MQETQESEPRPEQAVDPAEYGPGTGLQHPYVHHGLLGLQGQIEGRQL